MSIEVPPEQQRYGRYIIGIGDENYQGNIHHIKPRRQTTIRVELAHRHYYLARFSTMMMKNGEFNSIYPNPTRVVSKRKFLREQDAHRYSWDLVYRYQSLARAYWNQRYSGLIGWFRKQRDRILRKGRYRNE